MTLKEYHFSYKAKTELYPDNIPWCVDICATSLADAINQLYEMERVIKLIDVYEIQKN